MRINLLRTSAFRHVVGYGVIFTLGVSALLGAIYLLTESVLTNDTDAVISAELDGLTDEYNRGGLSQLNEELTYRADNWGRTGAVYLLVDANLNKEGGNLKAWPQGLPLERWVNFSLEARRSNDDITLHPVRASVMLLPEGHRLLVGTDVAQQRRFMATFRTATLWGIGLTALAGVLAGGWLSYRLSRRVQSVAEACDAIVGGDLGRRLTVSGWHDEFDALAQAVNSMVDRLAEKTQLLRATFDSAAHDLRAPLFRLRSRLEDVARSPGSGAALREGIDASLQELEHVQRTLTTLLQIAQAESGIAQSSAPVDLAKLASDMAELYEPAARERHLQLTVQAQPPCEVRGNRQLLAQVVANLVENSLKYVPPGGHIEVRAQRASSGSQLVVADNGPGIPAAERTHVLEPFVRLPAAAASTAGTGLGLSLVAAIARLHHAQLALEDNGPGLRVVLSFSSG
ncbi:MAG TPA: HAMP domain-containing sensor histidine kinase [Steroidobacteraceae bacterium]|nr:HAMP domain-containing sensor histidine kinase [Steroidobacteraceae bacterium]